MADWRKLAKALALADGRIDTKETNIIKKELLADGKLDRSELEFLLELRREAQGTVQEFNKFLFTAVGKAILADGEISAKEAAWLRKFIYADGKVDADEKQFLTQLKSQAQVTCPEFEQLVADALKA